MALVPLAWVAFRHRSKSLHAGWWWIAVAFSISWLADSAAHVISPWIVGVVYPVSQATLIGAVLLPRKEAITFLGVLTLGALLAVAWRGTQGPDVLFRTMAMLGVAGIVWDRWALGRLRTSLLVYFGLGWLCWLVYAGWPGWTSWGIYQWVRFLGIALFCRAVLAPTPHLRVLRRD